MCCCRRRLATTGGTPSVLVGVVGLATVWLFFRAVPQNARRWIPVIALEES